MIDLRSDTSSLPSPEMRDAARDAAVGNDVFGEDPSVNELEATAAELLGCEAALFSPSGTMANMAAVLAHTSRGQEVIVERASHIYGWECGGLAATAGLQVRPIDGGDDGLFNSDQLGETIVEPSLHQAETGLVCVENTHNHAGGVAHHPDGIAALREVAADRGLPVHLDGARVFNAAVALNLDPAELVEPVDSAMFSLSKGLRAPVGSILVGDEALVAEARRHRKRLGGGMRQAGIVAAPALIAMLDWDRLSIDHERAERLAAGLDAYDGLSVKQPETNIVLVDVAGADHDSGSFLAACADERLLGVAFGETVVRFCTYRDIDDDGIETAIDAVGAALSD